MAINDTISNTVENSLVAGALGGALLVVAIVLTVAYWIYTSFTWMEISRKLKQKNPGLMWIPFVRTARIFQLGGFHWAYIFLLLIPLLGWIAVFIISIISEWRIFEERKYPGALALIPIGQFIPILSWLVNIAWLIVLGFVAWKDRPKNQNKTK